jgi:ribonuclease HI
MYCDGARATSILISPSGIKLRYATRLQFIVETDKCSNNIAKSEVVLLGLCKLRAMGVKNCIPKMDSKVIASQIEKDDKRCYLRKILTHRPED